MVPESLQLLLIEDNPIDARVIQEYLAHTDGLCIELEHAALLSQGMARLQDKRFDAALLDLNLPDSVGLRTVEQVHASDPNVPIVVLTGEDADELALQVVQAGAEDYICKSKLEPNLLLRTIRCRQGPPGKHGHLARDLLRHEVPGCRSRQIRARRHCRARDRRDSRGDVPHGGAVRNGTLGGSRT